ncbi:hypothetical protein D9M71_369470 [compost metagenome]
MTGLQVHAVDFAAVEQKTCGVLRLQAFVRGIEHRGFDLHFAKRQGGVRCLELDRAATAGVIAFATTVTAHGQQTGSGMAFATVEFQSSKGMGIETETNCPRRETGFKSADKTLSPFGFVVFSGR